MKYNPYQSEKIAFRLLFFATVLVILPVILIVFIIIQKGISAISWEFLSTMPKMGMREGGIFPAILGTVYLVTGTLIFALPLGVLSAIYLTEYAKDNLLTRLVKLAIINLAGVPSVVYGLFGLGIFVMFFKFGASILAGSLTLAIMVVPIIITTSKEALDSVPRSFREVSLSLGASKWQTIRFQVLPAAKSQIFTGIILAMSRAIGETAPLIVLGALTYIPFLPTHPVTLSEKFPFLHVSFQGFLDPFTVLPIQIFNWVSRPQKGFLADAAAGIIVLLVITFVMNGVAVYLRYKSQKKLS